MFQQQVVLVVFPKSAPMGHSSGIHFRSENDHGNLVSIKEFVMAVIAAAVVEVCNAYACIVRSFSVDGRHFGFAGSAWNLSTKDCSAKKLLSKEADMGHKVSSLTGVI